MKKIIVAILIFAVIVFGVTAKTISDYKKVERAVAESTVLADKLNDDAEQLLELAREIRN